MTGGSCGLGHAAFGLPVPHGRPPPVERAAFSPCAGGAYPPGRAPPWALRGSALTAADAIVEATVEGPLVDARRNAGGARWPGNKACDF